jgi:hypothetical protein
MLTTTAADGAVGFAGWRDTQLGVDCGFATASDGREHCMPPMYAATGFLFADSACTQPLASSSPCFRSLIRYASSGGDGASTRYFEVTGSHGGALYQLIGPMCQPYSGNLAAFDIRPISVDTFVSGTLITDAAKSGTRIFRKSAVSSDGQQEPRLWYDSQLGVECAFSAAGDQRLRCLPPLALIDSFFADAGCTQPLAWAISGAPRYGVQQGAGCGTTPPTYFQLGASYGGTVYFKSGTSCFKDSSPPGLLLSLGAQVAVTNFVEGTLVTQ